MGNGSVISKKMLNLRIIRERLVGKLRLFNRINESRIRFFVFLVEIMVNFYTYRWRLIFADDYIASMP